jgi:double-stranded uracil-DNA glycosylase
MPVLPDYLTPGLDLVLVGTAVGTKSAERGHYYAGPGNEFWRFLFGSGLVPAPLGPEDDSRLPSYGIGLTDLVKSMAQSHDRGLVWELDLFTTAIARYQPRVVAFTSKKGGQAYARTLGHSSVDYGAAPWTVMGRPAFILPSPSAANRKPTQPPRLEWWRQLPAFIEQAG